jgi:hypothetical protein
VDIYKESLPAGWSYALKPSLLESAIADAGVRLSVSVHQRYKVWATSAPALSATFHPRGSYLGRDEGCFSVTSCAIPSSEREVLQTFAAQVFIPELVDWMMSIEALPQGSTIKRAEQNFACEGSPPALLKRPLPLISKGQRLRKQA